MQSPLPCRLIFTLESTAKSHYSAKRAHHRRPVTAGESRQQELTAVPLVWARTYTPVQLCHAVCLRFCAWVSGLPSSLQWRRTAEIAAYFCCPVTTHLGSPLCLLSILSHLYSRLPWNLPKVRQREERQKKPEHPGSRPFTGRNVSVGQKNCCMGPAYPPWSTPTKDRKREIPKLMYDTPAIQKWKAQDDCQKSVLALEKCFCQQKNMQQLRRSSYTDTNALEASLDFSINTDMTNCNTTT